MSELKTRTCYVKPIPSVQIGKLVMTYQPAKDCELGQGLLRLGKDLTSYKPATRNGAEIKGRSTFTPEMITLLQKPANTNGVKVTFVLSEDFSVEPLYAGDVLPEPKEEQVASNNFDYSFL